MSSPISVNLSRVSLIMSSDSLGVQRAGRLWFGLAAWG
jgi:hypothetical protein